MPYTNKQAMIDRFGENEILDATDRDRSGQIDEEVLDQAIADADAEINVYLHSRYETPVSDDTGLIERLASDLTRYYLWSIDAPEHVTDRYKSALSTLKDIGRGTVVLEATKAQDSKSSGSPVVIADDQIFTADQLKKLRP